MNYLVQRRHFLTNGPMAFGSLATPFDDLALAKRRVQDYSGVGGHTTSVSSPVETGTTAAPTVIGEASDGATEGGADSGGGSGGSSSEDGGDGDGEPPTTAGLTPDGDGQKPRPVWTLLKLLWGLVPSIRNIWHCLKFTFPHSVRQKVIRDELLSLARARRIARGKGLPFRTFVWSALRWRTALLVLRCVRESLKEAGIDVQLVLRL